MKARTVTINTFLLIAVDQVIKIIIHTYCGGYQFEIIPSIIDFKPAFNDNHSYVNVLLNKNFGLNIGLLPHIILFLCTMILVFPYFFYYRNNILRNTKLLDSAIIFLYAGIICALIGNLIWKKGTLDYIYLKPFFVFDLKDTYINLGIILFFTYLLKNRTVLKTIKTKDVFLYTKTLLSDKK